MFIGFYNYTVWLTYLSLVSGVLGIIVSLSGGGHPYLGTFCLLFSGLCDAYDGKVARSKKNRTEEEKAFGIQIDSLADLVSFGILPACIGAAMLRLIKYNANDPLMSFGQNLLKGNHAVFFAILVLYALAALIRLAYYNVQEALRQKEESGARKTYTGLPVTSASLIFPLVMMLQFSTRVDITLVYFIVVAIVAVAFVSKFHIPKPGATGLKVMVALGILEFIILIYLKCFR